MKTKKEILKYWQEMIVNSSWLWQTQAQINFNAIKKHTPKKALEILKKDYEKYKEKSCSGYTKQAI